MTSSDAPRARRRSVGPGLQTIASRPERARAPTSISAIAGPSEVQQAATRLTAGRAGPTSSWAVPRPASDLRATPVGTEVGQYAALPR